MSIIDYFANTNKIRKNYSVQIFKADTNLSTYYRLKALIALVKS